MILFLNILRFIGFLLLIFLLLILFAVIFILFIPIKYSIFAEKCDTIKVNVKIACLFNIIKYEYIYNDNNETNSLKIFLFELINKKKKRKKEIKLTKNKKQEEKSSYNQISENMQEEIYENKKIDINENNSYNNKIHNSNNKKIKKKKTLKRKNTVSLKERYLYLKNYPDKKKIFNITKKLVLRLFKAIKHKKLDLKIKFGFDDPYLTGCVLGLANLILSFLPVRFDVKGEFEKEVINFKLETIGSFNLFSILFPILIFVLSRPIWRIIRRKEVINE